MTEWIITSSVLIVIIAMLRFALRGKISLKLQYALWVLVLIRLLIPFSIFESPASVLNILNEQEEASTPPAVYEPYEPKNTTPAIPDEDVFILDDNIEHIEPETNIVIDDNGFITGSEIRVISAKDILIPVWIGGMVVLGMVFAVSNLRFGKKLKNTRAYLPKRNTWLPVYVTSEVKTPCLFGVSKPAIYITKEVSENEKVLHHVVEHETTHYRHGDHVWSVLRCLCLAVHWYNPLVWLAAFLSMRDSELACDEDTIKRIGENERVEYGRTLINLTCEKPAVGILSAATTMTGSKSSIKERIVLIAKKPKMLKITAAIVAIIAIFAVGCTFTGAIKYNPKTTENPVLETYADHIFIDIEYSDVDKIVSMKITSASSEEITTEVYNDTYKDVRYSNGYRLQFEQDGKWYELPILDGRTADMMFAGTSLKAFSSGKTSTWTNNIRESYGKLPDGKYRILRTFEYMGIAENPEAQSFVLATEFTLEDGKIPAETLRELNGEVTRGTFEGGFYYDFMGDEIIDFEGEHPIGSTYVKKAIYRNRAFGITVDLGENARFYDDESTKSFWNTFSDGKFDPNGAEFYDLAAAGGKGFGSIDIRYENMPKFRGKVLSEKEYAEIALDEFEKYIEEEDVLHYDQIIHYVVQEKEIDTVKIDGEVLYCLKYRVSLTGLEGKFYIGIVLRRTGDWMTNMFVTYSYTPGMEYAAKCITFD